MDAVNLLIPLTVIAAVAVGATLRELIRPVPRRVPTDPERLARLAARTPTDADATAARAAAGAARALERRVHAARSNGLAVMPAAEAPLCPRTRVA